MQLLGTFELSVYCTSGNRDLSVLCYIGDSLEKTTTSRSNMKIGDKYRYAFIDAKKQRSIIYSEALSTESKLGIR